jgi:hypothetical protein
MFSCLLGLVTLSMISIKKKLIFIKELMPIAKLALSNHIAIYPIRIIRSKVNDTMSNSVLEGIIPC